MILSFYTFGSPTAVLRLKMDESKSSLIEQLNETTRLAVTLTAPSAPALKIGMYTTYNGRDYYLIAEPSVTKVHSESYIIEADLESIAGLTKATILSNPIDKRTSFDYTATAREHLQLIADSLNQKLTSGGLKWAVGSVNCRNDVRHIKYDHVTTWAALQRIRETYKTDITINGTTISLGIPSDKASALELSYGKDKGLLSGLERVKHSDAPTPSRLYVTGTKRNMVKGTLTLEPSQVLKIDDTGRIQRIVTPSSGRIYTTDTDGRYVEIYTTDTTHLRTEATYTNEEIYPSHVSKVTTVEKVRDHFEVNCDLDLDYNKQTIAGEQMQIIFQSGNLAGREFDAVYKTSSKRFAITPKEEDETTLPNDILCPKVGDRYIITGIELPQQYIDEAQEKLTDAAVQQLEEMQNTRYSYKAEVDPVYLYNNRTAIADKLTVGKYVHLTDTQIAQGDPYIRITSKRTYLDRIYQPEIELSNEVEEYSFFERLKDSFIDIARIDRKGELARINRQIDVTMPDRIKDKIKGDTELQGLLKGEPGHNPNPSDVADLIANSKTYRDQITYGLPDENRVKELARELDNEREVGGRNLILSTTSEQKSLSWTDWYSSMDFKSVRGLTAGTYTLSFQLSSYEVQDREEGKIGIHMYVRLMSKEDREIKNLVDPFMAHSVLKGKYVCTFTIDDTSFDSLWFRFRDGFWKGRKTIVYSSIKLERGNVATDWTPAPEDMYAELDKYTTLKQYNENREEDRRQLEGKLDKPTNGSYVLDAEISNKIKDKVTNDKDLQAVIRGGMATPQQVRDIIDKRKLVRRNLLLNTRTARDQKGLAAIYKFAYPTEREGLYALSFDFVTKSMPIGGKMKVIFGYQTSLQTIGYIEDWYECMGHAKIGLNVKKNSQYTGLAKSIHICPNDEIVDESTPDCGAFTIRNVKLEYGNSFTDWEPAPEDAPFESLDTAKATLTSDIISARNRADNAYVLADNVKDDVNDLQPNVPTKDQKDWLDKMGKVLKPDSKVSGKTYHINGVNIDHSVFLSFSDGKPSALIGGQIGKGAVLMAGVQDYGTTNQRASTEIYQDGSAKFGAVKMLYNGMLVENDFMQMAFDKTAVQEPLLISDTQPKFVESLALSNVENRNVVSGANVYLTNNTRTRQYNFSTSNPSTKMTITIERVRCEVYPRNCALELLVDGVQIMSWRGDISYEQVDGSDFAGGGTKLNIQKTPSEETNITIERTLSKGNHTLLLRNSSTDSTDKGTFYGLKCNLYYDASKGSTILSASGFRAYTNNSRYFDIDRREKYYPPDASGGGGDDDLIPAEGMPNPYIARIRGGILLDRLDLEQPLDAPGCVLAGGRVENGYVNASFGKYKNQRGYGSPKARFDNDDKIYCVFHSIGNTNYTPIVTSCAGAFGDVPQVIGVYEYRFDVRFINYNNEPSVGWNFNYVCYKGE